MNILFVNHYYNLFANADSGASQRSMRLINALAQFAHVDVLSFVKDTISNAPNVDVVDIPCVSDDSIKEGGRLSKFVRLFKIHSPYSFYPPNRTKEAVIDSVVSQHDYQFIVTHYLHPACYYGLFKYADKLVVDLDDDPKDAMKILATTVKSTRNRIYTYISAYTWGCITRYVTSRIYHSFYSSPNKHYPNATFLPNVSGFEQPLPTTAFNQSQPCALLVGDYTYFPNKEGLTHFLRKIFPTVRQKLPNATLKVVGKMNDESLLSLCKNTIGVELRGYVNDLRQEYLTCQCVIVPLYKGTGTSVKVIEAMSLGRLVVSTPCGVRGLHRDFREGKDYLLAKSNRDFADKLVFALTNESKNNELAMSAIRKVNKHYSQEAYNSIVRKTFIIK